MTVQLPSDAAEIRPPVITVVMATYKRAHLIARSIQSVLAQTFPHWELVIVDDCSPDDTASVVRAFNDPRIRYLRHEKNGGASKARNTGILAAGPSQFLAYLDDDDEWYPEKLELQLELFRQSCEDLGVVGCGRSDHEIDEVTTHLPNKRGYIIDDVLARRAKGYGSNLILVKRSKPDVLFDEKISCLEDMEYALRLSRRWMFDFVPKVLVRLRRDDGGPHLWNAANSVKGHQAILEKYATYFATHPRVLAYYNFCIGRDLWELHRFREARAWFSRAIISCPRIRLRVWKYATFLGDLGLKVCARILEITPPE